MKRRDTNKGVPRTKLCAEVRLNFGIAGSATGTVVGVGVSVVAGA